MKPSSPTPDVDLCKSCGTMKHLNDDGLCGRCTTPESDSEVREQAKGLMHLQGCQSYTRGYNDKTDGKDLDTDWIETREDEWTDEYMQLIKAHTDRKVAEALQSIRDLDHSVATHNKIVDRIAQLTNKTEEE